MCARRDNSPITLLALLFSADLVFILVHVVYLHGWLWNPLFSIEMDRGYAEVYQYIKEYWIVLLLFILAIKTKQGIYLAWSALFMYLLLDDSLEIHEKLGEYLAGYFDFQPGLNLHAHDFGELAVSILFGSILFLTVGFAYVHCKRVQKKVSRRLFILVLLLAFFGVVVDMLHVALPWRESVLGIIEDGGEMLIMSIIVSYVFYLEPEAETLPVHNN